MKTKIINNKFITDEQISFYNTYRSTDISQDLLIDPLYTNYVRDVDNIYVYQNDTANLSFDTNFPKSNLLQESMAEEVRVSSYEVSSGVFLAGITIDLDNSSIGDYDCIAIRFNRNNEVLKNLIKSGANIFIAAHGSLTNVNSSTGGGGASKEIYQVSLKQTSTSFGTDTFSTNMIDPEDPVIIIDKTLRQHMTQYNLVNDLPFQYISVWFTHSADFTFSVSNVSVTNGVDFDDYFINGKIDSSRVSLTKTTYSPDRYSIKDVRGFYKKFKGNIDLLDNTQGLDLRKKVFDFCKDEGFFIFPNMEDQNFYMESLRSGGLYRMKEEFKVENTRYNIYNTSLDLEEVV